MGWLGAWQQRGLEDPGDPAQRAEGILERQSFEPEPILRSWRDRGWLLGEDENLTRKVTIGHRKTRCFVLKRECVDQVSGLN